MDLRPQAHDIITFWLFNTMIKSRLHFDKNPWKNTIISGYVTREGEKMSKSKGNIIRPQEIREKYGADAIRYWAASSKLGEDFDYQEKDVVTGAKFVKKLFNATKFVFMNMNNYKNKEPKVISEVDRIFMGEINKTITNSTTAFENYDYSRAKLEADSFFWKALCDNYLEIVKNRVYNGSDEEKESAKYTLYNSLLVILKLMAPITPFVTEEIYQEYFRKNEKEQSIHISSWPEKIDVKKNSDDEKIWSRLLEIIEKVRRAKSEAKKSMKAEVILTLSKEDGALLKECLADLRAVTNSKEIKEGNFDISLI
jgi:valyl-tRNA synthetase